MPPASGLEQVPAELSPWHGTSAATWERLLGGGGGADVPNGFWNVLQPGVEGFVADDGIDGGDQS